MSSQRYFLPRCTFLQHLQEFLIVLASIMCSISNSTAPLVFSCAQPSKPRRMVFAVGPIPIQGTVFSRHDDQHHKENLKHMCPRMCHTRSMPLDHHIGSPPGKSYEDIHRRDLLALGLFLTAAQAAGEASAGQSNSQLADQVHQECSMVCSPI